MPEHWTSPIPASSAAPSTIVRVVLTIGLALLLLVGAWTDSHGEDAAGVGVCVAAGVSAGEGSDASASPAADATSPHSGFLGICGVAVFLLALLALRFVRPPAEFRLGRAVSASVIFRARLAAPRAPLTLVEICVSRI